MEIKEIEQELEFYKPIENEDLKVRILDYPSVLHKCDDSGKYQELWDRILVHRSVGSSNSCTLCDMVEKGELPEKFKTKEDLL